MTIRIGVIDSGAAERQLYKVTDYRSFTDDEELLDKLGHGTAVIERLLTAEADFEICLARVFSDQLICSVDQCVAAIDWLVALNPVFINMSFGLSRDSNALREACARAVEAGVGLIAASPAQGAEVFPAALPGVVRATGDARCRDGEIAWLASTQADVAGYVGDPKIGPAGASIGCASVSARLLPIIEDDPDLEFSHFVELLAADAEYQGIEHKA